MVKEHEKNPSVLQNNEFIASTSQGLLCEHKDSKVNYFDLGLCESCYKDEAGIFSDIDDEEVDGYLCNEKEMQCKNIIWENRRQEDEEQAADEAVAAADEAVAAAKKEFYEAILNKCTMEDILEAKEHYESAVATLAKFRTRLGNKVNFDHLEKLSEDEDRLEKLFEDEPLADEEHY